MSGHDASHMELVGRSRCSTNPYQSRIIHYEKSQSIAVHSLPSRNSASGRLDLLPVELLHNIFLSLDFQALRCLRLVNFAMKQLVEALPAYGDLVKHAPNALRALADTTLLSYFGATQLYDALLSDRCAGCNEYGDFLFLPTGKRCCVHCIADHPYTRVNTVSAAKQWLGEASLTGLPIMHSLPGRYGLDDQLLSDRHWVVSMHAAHMRNLVLYGSKDEMSQSLKVELAKYAKKKAMAPEKLPGWPALFEEKFAGPETQSRQALEEKWRVLNVVAFRFMATTPFPSLNRHSRKIEHGVRCLACSKCFWAPVGPGAAARLCVGRSMDMSFSEEEFSEHIKKCPLIREYWNGDYDRVR